MTDRFKTISYRNATYFGQLYSKKHHGVGMVVDENWLFCLAQWENNKINGNCFMVFPDHRIFYGSFKNEKLDGIIVFVLSGECRIYAHYKNGQIQGNACIDFAQLKTILKVSGFGENKIAQIAVISETRYQQYKQKWDIISTTIKCQLIDQNKSFAEFVDSKFSKKYSIKLMHVINQFCIFVGTQGSTLGVTINPKNSKISSVGHFIVGHQIGSIGFKSISTISGDIFEQGNYLQPDSIIRYQLRPSQAVKIPRNYQFRSMEFYNQFLGMYFFQKIWSICKDIGLNLANIQTQKYAQVLLQNPNPLSLSQANKSQQQLNQQSFAVSNSILSFAHKKKSTQPKFQGLLGNYINGANPEKGNQKSIHKQRDASLQKIKQQVLRAAERRKNSRISSKDIVRQFSPSQLKQTPKKIAQRLQSPEHRNKSYLDSPQRYQRKTSAHGKAEQRVQQLMKQRKISPYVKRDDKSKQRGYQIEDRAIKQNSYFVSNQERNQQQAGRNQQFKVDSFNHHGQKYLYKYYSDEHKQSKQKKVSFNQNKVEVINQNIAKKQFGQDKIPQRKNSKSPNHKKAAQYTDHFDSFVQRKKIQNKQKRLQYNYANSDSLEYQAIAKRNYVKPQSKHDGQIQYLKRRSNNKVKQQSQLRRIIYSPSPNRIDKAYDKSPKSKPNYAEIYENRKQHKQSSNPQNINDEYREFERIKISSYAKKGSSSKKKQKITTPNKSDFQKGYDIECESPIEKVYQRNSLFKNENFQTRKPRKVFNYF